MDFQTLNRRELQALCKLNKIHANITNIAMVDALKSLKTVEGIDVYMNPSRTETIELSIESPERISNQKKAKLEHNEVLKPPLVSCTKKKDPETSSCQDIAKNQSLMNHEKNCIPNTPATYTQIEVTKSIHKETVKKETTTTVQRAYSTRRSTRLTAKKSRGPCVTSEEDLGIEKHDVIVLDENSEIDKVVHVNATTLESDADNLKVKLVKIFEQCEDVDLDERQNGGEKFDNSDEKSGQVDNLKPDLEGICNPSEPSKLDNHNADEVMNAEGIGENIFRNTDDFVYPKKQKASMNLEDRAREPQESLIEVEGIEEFLNPSRSEIAGLSIEPPARIEVTSPSSCCDVASQLAECEDNVSLVTKSTHQDTVSTTVQRAYNTSEAVKINLFLDEVKDLGKPIKQKHDVIVLDESLRIEKVDKLKLKSVVERSEQLEDVLMPCAVSGEKNYQQVLECNGDVVVVDFEEPQETLMPQIYDLNLEQLNQEGDGHEVTRGVDFSNEEKQISMNQNDDVIDHTMTSIRELTQVSDNNERKPVVVIEENHEKGLNEKAKSLLNTSISLRQLKKQMKVLSNSPITTSIRIKTEASDNSDMKKPEAVVVEENEEENNEKEGAEDDKKAKSLNDTSSLRQLKKQLKALSGKYNKDTS